MYFFIRELSNILPFPSFIPSPARGCVITGFRPAHFPARFWHPARVQSHYFPLTISFYISQLFILAIQASANKDRNVGRRFISFTKKGFFFFTVVGLRVLIFRQFRVE